MSFIKSVIVFSMMLFLSFSINSTERNQDQPVFGEEHLLESHFVKSVMDLYPAIPEQEARKVVGLVNYYSQELNIKPTVALAMIGTESSFKRTARSPTGAGYTQVYPRYHQDKIKNRDIFKTQVNIEVGMKILSDCKERRGSYQKTLACYNGAISKEKARIYYKKIRDQEKKIMAKVYEVFLSST